MFHFGRSRGGTWRDGARLFFYAVVKPALVFRGKARYEPARILNFSFKLAANRRVSIVVVSPLEQESLMRTRLFGGAPREGAAAPAEAAPSPAPAPVPTPAPAPAAAPAVSH